MKTKLIWWCFAIAATMFLENQSASAAGIKISAPAGGEVWYWDSTYEISWTADSSVKFVKLYIYDSRIPGSGSVNYLVDDALPANQGSYSWIINSKLLPTPAAGLRPDNYQIRIDALDSNQDVIASTFSNTFEISEPVTYTNEDNSSENETVNVKDGRIKIVAPVGGESWFWDNTYKIIWKADESIKKVMIYVYNEESDRGSGYINYIVPDAEPISAQSGSFSWNIQKNLLPAYDGEPALHDYYIRIDGVDDNYNVVSSVSTTKPLAIQSPAYQSQISVGITYENEDGTPLSDEEKKQLSTELYSDADNEQAQAACKNSETYDTAPLKHKDGGYLVPSPAGGCLDKDFSVIETFNNIYNRLPELEADVQKNLTGENLILARDNMNKIKKDLTDLQSKIGNLKTNEEAGALEPEMDKIGNMFWAVSGLNSVAINAMTNEEWASNLMKLLDGYKTDIKNVRAKISQSSSYSKKLDQFDAVLDESASLIGQGKLLEAEIKLNLIARSVRIVADLMSGGLMVGFNPAYLDELRKDSNISITDDLEFVSLVLSSEAGGANESQNVKENADRLKLIIDEQKKIGKDIEESKNKAEERSPVAKFFVGPDKKALKAIEDDLNVVKQNADNVSKISKELDDGKPVVQNKNVAMSEILSNKADAMNKENTINAAYVNQQKEGFSLLGWAM